MNVDDGPNLDLPDDPTPPDPDDAVLARVIGRGRQRQRRRRALVALAILPVVLAVVGGGVAVADHKSATPPVAVQPPPTDNSTTTSAPLIKVGLIPEPSTTTTASPTIRGGPATRSGPRGQCTTCVAPTTVPAGPDPRNPQAGDFSGSVTVDHATVVAGGSVWVGLYLHNIADHEVDASLATLPNTVALVCTSDLDAEGHTNVPLVPYENFFFVTNPPFAPGADGGVGPMAVPTSADSVGVITCEGVIATSSNGWQGGTLTSAARLTNIAPVTFTVLPAEPETTTSTTDTTTTTTTTSVPTP